MSEKVELPNYQKREWGSGPWLHEPDRIDFIHAGFSCFALRNLSGNWCGYVGVPSSHPSYGVNYDDVDVSVHGGLTYSDKCTDHICHIPRPGMPEDVWWLGFDTAHAGDMSPSPILRFVGGVYRDMHYVKREIIRLAEQLKELQLAKERKND